ncbi:MAG: MATE family efflux transporter [Bacteroidales bacterium]|nr:MATE family efflux transporter [Bacteroidales bacterium]
MVSTKDILLGKLRSGEPLRGADLFRLIMLMSLPAILAQLSMCLMSYIDAAMVGRLGSAQAAAVGLMSSSTWLFGSFCYGNSSGFTVQIAHRCGAGDYDGAKRIFREGLFTVLGISVLIALIAMAISGSLPHWLRGGPDIIDDARAYFRIYTLFLPVFQLAVYCESALIASGNMKVPSYTSVVMCVLDVVFNYFFIFKLGKGVAGAALGTGLAEVCAGGYLLYYACLRSSELRQDLRREKTEEDRKEIFSQAFGITWPLWIQNLVSRGAYVAATFIIAPLGTIAIAANSFAIIAEGFCYLPGFGVQDAATSLVGQSLGAGRKELARRISWISIACGAGMMTLLAVLMYAFAPQIMALLSQDPEVIALGARCLRIEAWAELLFGVSIVGYGCCVGAGDTLVPSVINFMSMWIIRLGLALMLIPRFGLAGYWIGMATELCVKGIIFAIRISGTRWMRTKLTAKTV